MHEFRKCLGEPVGKRFEHDRVVIVVLRFESLDQRIDADAGGHREAAEVILDTAFLGRHEIAQTMIGTVLRFDHLLAQITKCREHPRAGFVRVHLDVVAVYAVGQEESDGRTWFRQR